MDKTKIGIYEKFNNIERTDGSHLPGGKHHGCTYFVLDLTHDKHAKPAMAAYAESCKEEFPLLSEDAREVAGDAIAELASLRGELAAAKESIESACAEADIVGYYGGNLDSAIQCFREKFHEQTARAEAAEKELAETKEACASNAKAWLDCVEESAIKRTHLMAEIGLTEQQRDAALLRATQAEAQAERLREALEKIRGSAKTCAGAQLIAHAAIAETSAQSLAKHDAEVKANVLREFAKWADDQTKDEEDSFFRGITTADDAREMADRLEQEAAGGEAHNAE